MQSAEQFHEAWVINGPGESGKDEFVASATGVAERYGIRTHNFSSIDPARNALRAQGIDPSIKTDEVRRMLVAFKQEWMRRKPDGPNLYLLGCVRKARNGLIFIHIREPDQIARLVEMGEKRGIPIQTMHVIRPGHPIPDNPIDQGTLGPPGNRYPYTEFHENVGTLEDLHREAERFVQTRLALRGIHT